MSVVPQLTIAGDTDLAANMGRHALSAGIADLVYLWRDLRDPLASDSPVFVVAEGNHRADFARAAIDAGLQTVSLPIHEPDESLAQSIEAGTLRQISRLHGLPTLARLHADVSRGLEGRRYGVFAAHRLPRNHADQVTSALNDLVAYVTSLTGGALTSVRATSTLFGGDATDAWFVLARFADETIATIEVDAVLPDANDPNGELLVEVTGADAVLRAEPERQAVEIVTTNGAERQPWYADPDGPLLDHALKALKSDDLTQQISLLRLMQNFETAASSVERVEPER